MIYDNILHSSENLMVQAFISFSIMYDFFLVNDAFICGKIIHWDVAGFYAVCHIGGICC